MKLKFVGTGSAFSSETNNSAYFINNNNLFLIDCGETVFPVLKKSGVLEKVDNIYVFITHTHSDHIGSLSSLIYYVYYAFNKKLHILTSKEYEIEKDINTLLTLNGNNNDQYEFVDKNIIKDKMGLESINLYNVRHVPELKSYAVRFLYKNNDDKLESIVFTGDTCDEEFIVQALKDKYLTKIYSDISLHGYPHLSFERAVEIFNPYKDKVVFMHLESPFIKNRLERLGFEYAKQSVEMDKEDRYL